MKLPLPLLLLPLEDGSVSRSPGDCRVKARLPARCADADSLLIQLSRTILCCSNRGGLNEQKGKKEIIKYKGKSTGAKIMIALAQLCLNKEAAVLLVASDGIAIVVGKERSQTIRVDVRGHILLRNVLSGLLSCHAYSPPLL